MPSIEPRLTIEEKIKSGIKNAALKGLHLSGGARLLGSVYGGRGVVLMYHEFTQDPQLLLGQGARIADFERSLAALADAGRDFVTLTEAIRRVADPQSKPFVALTFDDGYRCNFDLALPVMEKFGAPATVFIPTRMIDRSINAWWLALREMSRTCDKIDMEPMNTRFFCSDIESRKVALRRMTAWVWEDFSRSEQLEIVFQKHSLSMPDVVEKLIVDEEQMIEADRHPLIEIGAHTTAHQALALLDDTELRQDIADNKKYLERTLEREVPHFAYPYGPPSISGMREANVLKDIGFASAWTTEPGCLFPIHGTNPFLLPRQNAENPENGFAQTGCGVHGVFRAISSRFGSPVVHAEAFS